MVRAGDGSAAAAEPDGGRERHCEGCGGRGSSRGGGIAHERCADTHAEFEDEVAWTWILALASPLSIMHTASLRMLLSHGVQICGSSTHPVAVLTCCTPAGQAMARNAAEDTLKVLKDEINSHRLLMVSACDRYGHSFLHGRMLGILSRLRHADLAGTSN